MTVRNIAIVHPVRGGNNQPPANEKDLMEYLKTSASKGTSRCRRVLHGRAKAQTASTVVIAYDRTPTLGNHFVAMGVARCGR
jgi:hypothetical protein